MVGAAMAGAETTESAYSVDQPHPELTPPDGPDPRDPAPVVGGQDTPSGAWPDVAALFTLGDSFGCTGTLIAPDLVLTAGHCGFGLETAVLDTDDHAVGGERIAVVESYAHDDYFTTFDVAVMVLASPSTVPPRPLALDCIAADYIHDGAEVAIVGYGAVDEWANDWTSRKQQATTTVFDADCDDLTAGCNAPVSPGGEVLAGGDGIDSCNGDSGGPLFLLTDEGDYLAGITSRAAVPSPTPCGNGGIYVRADAIADWVEEVTGQTLPRPDCDGLNRSPHPSAEPIRIGVGGTGFTTIVPNDPNVDDTHRFEIVQPPSHGLAYAWADGRVAYVPSQHFLGSDTFTVRAIDSGEPVESGDVEVAVEVVPRVGSPTVEPHRGCTTARRSEEPARPGRHWLGALSRRR